MAAHARPLSMEELKQGHLASPFHASTQSEASQVSLAAARELGQQSGANGPNRGQSAAINDGALCSARGSSVLRQDLDQLLLSDECALGIGE